MMKCPQIAPNRVATGLLMYPLVARNSLIFIYVVVFIRHVKGAQASFFVAHF